MAINISLDVGVLLVALFTLEYKLVRGFFEWLEELLSAKLMFIAFGIAFALCAWLQLMLLETPSAIPLTDSILQVSILCMFAGFLGSCSLAVAVTCVDAIHKYVTRTPIYFQY